MNLKPNVRKNFLDLFYHEIKDNVLINCRSKINLFILKIENNRFIYSDLVDELADCIISFALSRNEIQRYKDSEGGKKYRKAVRKLRDYDDNEGELGEILLYCLLESHLGAPKIFTKLELKMSSNDYVKGSDGVHLLEIAPNKYQLIFGESKLDNNLTRSLSEAFKSIYNFINRKENNIHDEIELLDVNLTKESYSDELIDFLKKIIIPTRHDENITKNNAFAIFASFDLFIEKEQLNLENEKFVKLIRKRIRDEVNNRMKHIEDKIGQYNLYGYDFYIYVFPFTELEEKRKQIIKDLVTVENASQ